jgi:hypothetical protein
MHSRIRQYIALLQKLYTTANGANSMFIMKWLSKINGNEIAELQSKLELAKRENDLLLREISALKRLVHDIEINYTTIISK